MASNTPKTMSSRLATMKFMQRSAAKSAGSEPSTPNGPPAKKLRLSNGTSAPGTPGTPSDHEVLQSTLAAEAKKREEALARAAEKSGETKWVLSFKDQQNGSKPAMQVRQAGFAVIDAEDSSDDEEEQKPARMQFGGGVKKKQVNPVTPIKAEEDLSDSDSDSSSDEFDSDDPTAELIRETRREVAAKERDARKANKNGAVDPSKRASALMDEDMDLVGLQSLSGGGGRQSLGARNHSNSNSNHSNVECFSCGQKGHFKGQCPNRSTPRGSAGRGRGRGKR